MTIKGPNAHNYSGGLGDLLGWGKEKSTDGYDDHDAEDRHHHGQQEQQQQHYDTDDNSPGEYANDSSSPPPPPRPNLMNYAEAQLQEQQHVQALTEERNKLFWEK